MWVDRDSKGKNKGENLDHIHTYLSPWTCFPSAPKGSEVCVRYPTIILVEREEVEQLLNVRTENTPSYSWHQHSHQLPVARHARQTSFPTLRLHQRQVSTANLSVFDLPISLIWSWNSQDEGVTSGLPVQKASRSLVAFLALLNRKRVHINAVRD